MGLYEILFPKKEQHWKEETTFRTLTAYEPHFTSYSGSLYEQDLVRDSIDACARHCAKLNVVWRGASEDPLRKKLEKAPNEWTTWSQFLYRLETILLVQNTAVILPVINKYGDTTGIFVTVPKKCELKQYNGVAFLRFEYVDGKHAAIELDKCGIMTRFQYDSDFFGDKRHALQPTLDLITLQHQAIKEAVKNGSSFRFMATLSNFTNANDLAAERKRFVDFNLKASEENGGFLLFPNTYKDVRQIESKPYVVDAEQRKTIETGVYNYFGTNEKIIQNAADSEELDAFYAGAIEPFAIQLGEVLTKMLLSDRQREFKNFFEVTSNRLSNMSIKNKISFATALADRGMIMIDEIREMFGYDPLPDGKGQVAPIRGEYYYVQEGKANNPIREDLKDVEEEE